MFFDDIDISNKSLAKLDDIDIDDYLNTEIKLKTNIKSDAIKFLRKIEIRNKSLYNNIEKIVETFISENCNQNLSKDLINITIKYAYKKYNYHYRIYENFRKFNIDYRAENLLLNIKNIRREIHQEKAEDSFLKAAKKGNFKECEHLSPIVDKSKIDKHILEAINKKDKSFFKKIKQSSKYKIDNIDIILYLGLLLCFITAIIYKLFFKKTY